MDVRAARWVGSLVAVALAAGAVVSCTPPPPPGPTPAQSFCSFWEEIAQRQKGDDPPAVLAAEAALVRGPLVAFAERTALDGASCSDPSAFVELDGAALAQGVEFVEPQGPSTTARVVRVTGGEVSGGERLLGNVRVGALDAEVRADGVSVRGNTAVTVAGTTSTMGFSGTLQDAANWTVALSPTKFYLPRLSPEPFEFSGSLRVVGGVPTLELTAVATSVTVGDVVVGSATIDVVAAPSIGVRATVSGEIRVGSATVSGSIDIELDRTGALVSISAAISVRLQGQQADGSIIDLSGDLTIVGNTRDTAVTFIGSGSLGGQEVVEANGSLKLEVNQATFNGFLDLRSDAVTVRVDALIVWSGQVAYTEYLAVQGSGQYVGALDDGTEVSARGNVTVTDVGGVVVVTVDGDFRFGNLRARGSAIVDASGSTTALTVLDAEVVNSGYAAKLAGAVVLEDGRAVQVDLRGSVDGSVELGDAALQDAALTARSANGGPLDIGFSGRLQIGDEVDGGADLRAALAPDGALISLNGTVNGNLLLDSWRVTGLTALVSAGIDQVTIDGSGTVSISVLKARLTGQFTSRANDPTWALTGFGTVTLGPLVLANARLRLTHTDGMQAIRAGFTVSLLGIPLYVEADFYLTADGQCSKVVTTGGGSIARSTAKAVLRQVLGCPVF